MQTVLLLVSNVITNSMYCVAWWCSH